MQNKKPYLLFTALLAILGLTSCAPSYHFKVDAISDAAIAKAGSFYLVSGNPEMKENDLRFKEAGRYVTHALEGLGYYPVNDIASADVLIELSFKVGEPRDVMDVRTYPETYWRPGYAFTVQIPVHNDDGFVIGYRSQIVHRPPRSYTYWEERIDSSTVYEKELKIAAYDNQFASGSSEPQQLWGVIVTNVDGSENIRAYLPYMITAALPYIGEDTGKQVYVSVDQEDPKAQFIRNPDAPITQ